MSHINDTKAGRLDVIYYTDPLCCWSWGLDPHIDRLKTELGPQLSIRYCMGGLIESWDSFNDGINTITKPIQMGPLWMQASHVSGLPMSANIWVTDPPASSYLACIAVKCAFLQSQSIGEEYLKTLRKQLMLNGCNISRQSALLQIAEDMAVSLPGFNLLQFKANLEGDIGRDAFRTDLQEVRYKNISRFPTLIISNHAKASIILTGYRKYDALRASVRQLLPDS